MIKSLNLFQTIHPLRLAVFRIGFGLFATLEVLYFYQVNLIEDYIKGPKFLFNYDFLPLEPLSEGALQVLLFITLISAICITLGLFYRYSTISFFVLFSYFFLLDKSYYNNHIYLLGLLGFLLIFIPANQALSLRKVKARTNLRWHLLVLQLQLVLVYFFGGLAKINADWLIRLEPVKSLASKTAIESEFFLYFISWGGMLFDLLVGLFLFIPKTRKFAIVGILLFSISNHLLFDDINIFPFFMMAALVLFMKPEEWNWLSKYDKRVFKVEQKPYLKKASYGMMFFFAIQFTLPLRHYFIPSNADWTSETQRFSWRMKIQTRELEKLEYVIFDLDKKTIYPVTLNMHLHAYQINQLKMYPRMMLDFAHYLGEYAKSNGVRNPMVKADIVVGMNGRKPQAVFSKDLDLLQVKWDKFGRNKWISPLNQE